MDDENGAVEADAHVLLEGGEPVAAVVSLPEAGEENEAEESEAVKLARIAADTTVTVAAIEADVETARIEAEEKEPPQWEERLAALETTNRSLLETVETMSLSLAALAVQSIPTPPPAEPEPGSETAPEPSLIPPPIAEPETVMEPGPAVEEESREPEAAPARKRRRLI